MSVYDEHMVKRGPNKGQMKPPEKRTGLRWRVHFEDMIAGKWRDKHFARRAEAEKFDAKKKSEKDQGIYIDEKAGEVLVRDFTDSWLKTLTLRPNTVEHYTRIFRKHIVPHLGHLQMNRVTRDHIRGWVKIMADGGYAASTINVYYTLIAGLFKSAMYDHAIGVTPCRKIALPTPPKRTKWLPKPHQVQTLIDAIDPRYALAVYLAAGCGLRWSEIMGLTTGDVDFENGSVHVRHQLVKPTGAKAYLGEPKTVKSARSLDMPADVADAAREHISAGYGTAMVLADHTVIVRPGKPPAERPVKLLFSKGGAPMHRSDWTVIWRKAVAAIADAPASFTAHNLRHYFVSLLIEAGASVTEVQEAVGHADPSTTLNVYAWPSSEKGRSRKMIEAAFAQGRGEVAEAM